jgi:hypothetical protein
VEKDVWLVEDLVVVLFEGTTLGGEVVWHLLTISKFRDGHMWESIPSQEP